MRIPPSALSLVLAGCAVQPEGPWSGLDIESQTACALTGERDVYCWGEVGAFATPWRHGSFDAVSVGGVHACGIAAGAVECWGGEHVGGLPEKSRRALLELPAGDYAEVEAGGLATCARDTGGEVTCTGNLGSPYGPPEGVFVDVSAGRGGACALDDAGMTTCWGIGLDEATPPTVPLVRISVGDAGACGIDAAGTLYWWSEDGSTADLAPLTDGATVVSIDVDEGVCVQLDDGRSRCLVGDDVLELGEGLDELQSGAGFACGLTAGEIVCTGVSSPPLPS